MNEDDLTKKTIKEKKVKATAPKKTATAKAKTTKKTAVKAISKTEPIVEAKAKKPAKTKAIKAVAKSTAEKTIEAKPKVTKARTKKAVPKTIAEDLLETSKPISLQNPVQAEIAEKVETVETIALSPIFKELAEPKLPNLQAENRAFLQIQSPTKIFFYWSLKNNSDAKLRKMLGNRANEYNYAIRLTNLKTKREEIYRAESKGSYWFNNVEADTKYRAEVGFHAPNRPFVRIIFSNILQTPRLKPSANTAYQPYFAVTSNQFADVLDMAGFSQDAFDVYLQGDEPQIADNATQKAFVKLVGDEKVDFTNINVSELRYILFALASGVSLIALREQVSSDLFNFLGSLIAENPNALTEEKVILALEEFFGFSPFEENEITEEFSLPSVFGASSINFPKGMNRQKSNFTPNKKRFNEGKLNPLSSFSLK